MFGYKTSCIGNIADGMCAAFIRNDIWGTEGGGNIAITENGVFKVYYANENWPILNDVNCFSEKGPAHHRAHASPKHFYRAREADEDC